MSSKKKILIANSQTWFEFDHSIAERNSISFISRPEELQLKEVQNLAPDVIFFPHWNWIIPEEIHSQFKCVGFHVAPLPFGRGGSPIQNLIRSGVKTSPVCAIQVNEQVDGGAIYASRDVCLLGDLRDIFVRVNNAVNFLISLILETEPIPKPQNGIPFYFSRLGRVDNVIPEHGQLSEIYDKIRMVGDYGYPCAFIEYGEWLIEFHSPKYKNDVITCETKITRIK